MNTNEAILAALQKQVRVNALNTVVLTIDLYIYKAQMAQKRWGTPGGNDVAQEQYQYVQELLAQTEWPSEVQAQATALNERITFYRTLLKAKDVTRVSFETTRLAADFRALREALAAWSVA